MQHFLGVGPHSDDIKVEYLVTGYDIYPKPGPIEGNLTHFSLISDIT